MPDITIPSLNNISAPNGWVHFSELSTQDEIIRTIAQAALVAPSRLNIRSISAPTPDAPFDLFLGEREIIRLTPAVSNRILELIEQGRQFSNETQEMNRNARDLCLKQAKTPEAKATDAFLETWAPRSDVLAIYRNVFMAIALMMHLFCSGVTFGALPFAIALAIYVTKIYNDRTNSAGKRHYLVALGLLVAAPLLFSVCPYGTFLYNLILSTAILVQGALFAKQGYHTLLLRNRTEEQAEALQAHSWKHLSFQSLALKKFTAGLSTLEGCLWVARGTALLAGKILFPHLEVFSATYDILTSVIFSGCFPINYLLLAVTNCMDLYQLRTFATPLEQLVAAGKRSEALDFVIAQGAGIEKNKGTPDLASAGHTLFKLNEIFDGNPELRELIGNAKSLRGQDDRVLDGFFAAILSACDRKRRNYWAGFSVGFLSLTIGVLLIDMNEELGDPNSGLHKMHILSGIGNPANEDAWGLADCIFWSIINCGFLALDVPEAVPLAEKKGVESLLARSFLARLQTQMNLEESSRDAFNRDLKRFYAARADRSDQDISSWTLEDWEGWLQTLADRFPARHAVRKKTGEAARLLSTAEAAF